MKPNVVIPDHSLGALMEDYDAALYALAFQELEQEELAMMREKIEATSCKPRREQFAQTLNRRLRRERARVLVLHALPRAAQIAACLIAVLSIGAGVALAASQEARSWVAGVLTGAAIEDGGSGIVDEHEIASITDGVNLDDRLLLLEDGETLTLRENTDAEPMCYAWKDRGARRLEALENCDGTLYALYQDGVVDDLFDAKKTGAFGGDWGSFDSIGLGSVSLSPDGNFTVEELANFDVESLFKPDATSGGVERIAAGNGKLYFTTRSNRSEGEGIFFGGTSDERLLAVDLSSYALTELPSPIEETSFPGYRLFGDGTAYVAVGNPTRVFRIEPDGSYTLMAEFESGMSENSYAYRAATDTFYYQQDAAIYAAPHFDIGNARRVALSGGDGGRALLLGENSYAIVRYDGRCEVFDFDEKIGDMNELVVGGNIVPIMSDELRAAMPKLTLVSDPMDNPAEGEADYRQKLLSGEAKADLVSSFFDEDGALRDAGWGKPIADEVICAEIDRMPEGVRKYVTKDGAYIGFPHSTFYAYSDVSVSPARWSELGLGELPETWLELLQKLAELSHSENAGKYPIYPSQEESGVDPAELLARRVVDGFARNWSAQGLAPDFGGEDFRAALEALRSIDFGALCFTDSSNWGEDSQLLLHLYGNSYDPLFLFDSEANCTLKIRPEDERISAGSCYIDRVNPATGAEELAYEYLRTQIQSNDQYVYTRMRSDFTTPAEELAEFCGGNVTAEDIETYRDAVGDVWLDPACEQAQGRYAPALNAWANGEMDVDALTAFLNETYA